MDILNDEENQRIFRGRLGRKRQTILFLPMLFMLSHSGDRVDAAPFAVLLVPKKHTRAAQLAIQILRPHKSLHAYGLQYTSEIDDIEISADDGASLPGLGSIHRNGNGLSGKTVLVCPANEISSTNGRLATVGGVLKLGPNAHYAMTCAHVFHDFGSASDVSDEDIVTSDSDTDDTDGSIASPTAFSQDQSSDEGPVMHAVFRPLPPKSSDVDRFSQWLETDSVHRARHIGNAFTRSPISPVPQELLFNAKLDWALVEVTDPRLWTDASHSLPCVSTSTMQPPKGNVIILWESQQEARSFGTKSALDFPWMKGFVEVWAIEGRSGPGACGAWVVEQDSGSVAGIVVAHSKAMSLTWMLPAHEIFADIKSRWELHGFSVEQSLSHACHSEQSTTGTFVSGSKEHGQIQHPEAMSLGSTEVLPLEEAGNPAHISGVPPLESLRDDQAAAILSRRKQFEQATANTRRKTNPDSSGPQHFHDTSYDYAEDINNTLPWMPGIPEEMDRTPFVYPTPSGRRVESRFERSDSAFFRVGRVFVMMPQGTLVDDGWPSGQTGLRRPDVWTTCGLVVVSREQGCVCVPIRSYGGRPLRTLDMEQWQKDAHAVVSSKVGGAFQPPRVEPNLLKKPIVVRLNIFQLTQEFPPVSYIYFGEHYTFQEEAEVIDLGVIDERSMRDFEQYWREEVNADQDSEYGPLAID
ncbi:hypothetical protein LTR10_012765 [Elasticomyces elasticus]|uniref:DUF6590 domain-containing protein n=1 Tax=Exophiala sideris TaxID=1016849 RepID=A0ABR0JSI9_9EURO|nr:hypothetical protein LTR10_012765 [Elasticomyces elasticus]KAK5034642.1 hypothetical protein LTR13_006298 [Exophiala sideris]KAK5040036.1 hypothetical protein LTS07_000532 [Exophiala sideris]KAK5068414.1 hypothetical protein LTR69_000533 [Exophiala sideris]KAK5187716.1 hypothetical protein LTR44_000533 [Eurotiomycetes sp. CCFEE 6388]